MLNFTLKLIYDENKEIKFGDKEKKNPFVNFLPEFLARVNLSEKNKRLENSILRTYLLSLKKDLANF